MYSRRLKSGYFIVEGLNSFATVYYLYYFFYFMQQNFGFGNKANLVLAALNGGVYGVGALLAGKVAQKFGYVRALKGGLATMMLAMLAGMGVTTATGHTLVMVLMVTGMCFTWPTLEALVSEGEPRGGVQHMVGVYNVVWATTAALANFTGGAMLQHLGSMSLFYVPLSLLAAELGLTVWLEWQAKRSHAHTQSSATSVTQPSESELHSHPGGQRFLKMAWLANPFAYIALNTLIAVVPGVALRLGLSTMLAGFCCSVWSFARLGAFAALWLWPGWHYRFRWLLLSYLTLVGTFAVILLAPNVTVLVLAQLAFGGAIGLIYYSSLFYSMDLSDTKGEHGGIHEAAIGLGNLAGPAVGAAALQFGPANSGTYAVSLLLLGGLAGLLFVWNTGRARSLRSEPVPSCPGRSDA